MKRFLHVGCGHPGSAVLPAGFRTGEWEEVRLDIDPETKPDVIASITNLEMFEDGTFDALFSHHNLEHLYPHEATVALKEFSRVLKPDGLLVVATPDLQGVAELIAADNISEPAYISPAGPIHALDIVYGYRPSLAGGNLYMAHRNGFTIKSIMADIMKAGFAQVRALRGSYSLWALGYKGVADDARVLADHNAFFPLSEPMTTLKP